MSQCNTLNEYVPCLVLDIVVFRYQFPQSHKAKYSLRLKFGQCLLLYCSDSALLINKWEDHSVIIIVNSYSSPYTQYFQKRVGKNMKKCFLVILVKKASLEMHDIKSRQLMELNQEMTFIFNFNVFIPFLTTFCADWFQNDSYFDCELDKKSQRREDWCHQTKNRRLCDFIMHIFFSSTTHSKCVIVHIPRHSQEWWGVRHWFNSFVCFLWSVTPGIHLTFHDLISRVIGIFSWTFTSFSIMAMELARSFKWSLLSKACNSMIGVYLTAAFYNRLPFCGLCGETIWWCGAYHYLCFFLCIPALLPPVCGQSHSESPDWILECLLYLCCTDAL